MRVISTVAASTSPHTNAGRAIRRGVLSDPMTDAILAVASKKKVFASLPPLTPSDGLGRDRVTAGIGLTARG